VVGRLSLESDNYASTNAVLSDPELCAASTNFREAVGLGETTEKTAYTPAGITPIRMGGCISLELQSSRSTLIRVLCRLITPFRSSANIPSPPTQTIL